MISRFFKKKESPAATKKITKAEKIKGGTPHRKILTAEGWRRMMVRSHKGKKAL